jgi:hypothetical protein
MNDGQGREISEALVNAVFDEPDEAWIFGRCLELAARGPWEVAAASATCIGNLARLRRYFRDDMEPVLESMAASDRRVRPYAEDAIENVKFARSSSLPGDKHA